MGQRGRGKERVLDSMLNADPDSGFNLTTLRSQPEMKPKVRYLTDCVTPAPHRFSVLVMILPLDIWLLFLIMVYDIVTLQKKNTFYIY